MFLTSKILETTIGAILIMFVLTIVSFAQVPKWFTKLQQIEIAKSTRADVEKILDFPKITQIRNGKWNQMIDYDLEIGKLEVSYSTGECSQPKNADGYNLDKNIVINVSLLLFEDVKISQLKLDLRKFRKHKGSDTNSISYDDDINGIKYSGGKKTISSIDYFIGEKYDYLDCNNLLQKTNL